MEPAKSVRAPADTWARVFSPFPLVVNLFGGPGAGKSTLAAGVFAELKNRNVNVELVTEFAKEMAWEGNEKLLENQALVFGNQLQRIERLRDKVTVAVTDSPLLLSSIYRPLVYPDSFDVFVRDMHNKFRNLNIFINRSKPYNTAGRFQTEQEAIRLDAHIRNLLDSWTIPYSVIGGSSQVYAQALATAVTRKLRDDNARLPNP